MGATSSKNSTLTVALQNKTSSSTVHAYITGQAINNNYALFLLQADGKTPYYPSSPNSNGSPLAVNCSIALGPPGSTTIVTIPQIAGGRIWFCVEDTLTFLLNPGPGLVEPSVSNPSDPNYSKLWDFCEFTYNSREMFVNITYVDFVSLPIALTLVNKTGGKQHVSGMTENGLETVCSKLLAQNTVDGAGWDQLIVKFNGKNLRALSPNGGIIMNPSLFSNYYANYVNAVWSKYSTTPLILDTQAQWNTLLATVINDRLTFPDVGSFSRPSAADIFSCSTGPFAGSPANTALMGAITARLSAALNRSTLLFDGAHPTAEAVADYYAVSPTNHYARIVHATNLDARGYAFPYDDVGPSGGADQSGSVSDGNPVLLNVAVGGIGAFV